MSLVKEDHISSPPSASQLQFCSPNFFRCLDRNQDDSLDFWEVLTLYYIMKTRGVWCKSCGVCQLGLYFTCVACFDNASHTYDLCTNCYSQRRYSHHHVSFLYSYMLLRSKRGLPLGAPNLNQFPSTLYIQMESNPNSAALAQQVQALVATIEELTKQNQEMKLWLQQVQQAQ
ncbi:uncharacterized protein LOC115949968 [Quercus lobata]|uniref:uncharacterized protein LOC115949968 n=1 Tax=Quercus lobata TaxID=97700 RepID=UPI0012475359|nr:uncharacterized protein LOC115949968 [Quercus lobata]